MDCSRLLLLLFPLVSSLEVYSPSQQVWWSMVISVLEFSTILIIKYSRSWNMVLNAHQGCRMLTREYSMVAGVWSSFDPEQGRPPRPQRDWTWQHHRRLCRGARRPGATPGQLQVIWFLSNFFTNTSIWKYQGRLWTVWGQTYPTAMGGSGGKGLQGWRMGSEISLIRRLFYNEPNNGVRALWDLLQLL